MGFVSSYIFTIIKISIYKGLVGGWGDGGRDGLHRAYWNDLSRLQARDVATWSHTTLLDKGEANEQSHVTARD